MRFAGALVLVVVLVVVAETRPPRDKRGIKICSARDVKFMATFVCNLHRRSVRSVDAADFGFQGSDDGYPLFGSLRNPSRRPDCNDNGGDCDHQIDASDLTSSQLNYLQAWLEENGYIPTVTDDHSPPRMNRRNNNSNDNNNNNNNNNNNRRSDRTQESNGRLQREGDINSMLEGLASLRSGQGVKGSVAKRDKEIDWPLVPSMTLGDIRKNCCLRHCRVEDFYGACS